MRTLTTTGAFDKQPWILLGGRGRSHRRSWVARLILAMLALGLTGCGRQPGFEVYLPAPQAAKSAVLAVLEAWKQGRPLDEAVGPDRDVHCVDKQRRLGQSLAGFELLGEIQVDNARGFLVRLHLQNPEQTQVARFLAVGAQPMWVFRGEDYEMIAHWMHPMEPTAPAPTTPAVESSPAP